MTRDQIHNLGLGPTQKSNQQPFSGQDAAESLWPDRILTLLFFLLCCCFLALATCLWPRGPGITTAAGNTK